MYLVVIFGSLSLRHGKMQGPILPLIEKGNRNGPKGKFTLLKRPF